MAARGKRERGGVGRPLLGRDRELDLIAGAIDGAAESVGSVLIVEGPPGIGKTTLLKSAAATAAERGFAVLESRGSELEREFTFGVVRQLCEEHVSKLPATERDHAFAGAAATAQVVLSANAPGAGPGPGDLYPLLHGLYWLCANLAESRPLLLVFDDAHWSDEPSLRFLHYLSRRIDGLPIVAIASSRSTAPEAPVDLIEETRAEPGVLVAEVPPLAPADCERLVAGVFNAKPDGAFADACRHASGGNPFLLNELVRSLMAEGAEPSERFAPRAEATSPATVSRSVFGGWLG